METTVFVSYRIAIFIEVLWYAENGSKTKQTWILSMSPWMSQKYTLSVFFKSKHKECKPHPPKKDFVNLRKIERVRLI